MSILTKSIKRETRLVNLFSFVAFCNILAFWSGTYAMFVSGLGLAFLLVMLYNYWDLELRDVDASAEFREIKFKLLKGQSENITQEV